MVHFQSVQQYDLLNYPEDNSRREVLLGCLDETWALFFPFLIMSFALEILKGIYL